MRFSTLASARIAAFPPSIQAAFWIMLSGFTFTISITGVRAVTEELHVLEAVFFRNVFGIAFMLPWLIRNGPRTALGYLGLPVAALMGFLIFGKVPTIWVWVGGAVIASAAAYITHREASAARPGQEG